MNVVAAETIR